MPLPFFGVAAPLVSRPAVLRAPFAGRSSVGSGAPGSSIAVGSGTGSPLPGLAVLPAEPRATFFFALASVFAPDPVCAGVSVVFASLTGGES